LSGEIFGSADAVRACEERIVNCWPAPSTLWVDGFIVRFAQGYSGRANSATPLLSGARLDPVTLRAIEVLYREAGLPPTFRDNGLMSRPSRALLDEQGYRIKDSSFGMILDLEKRVFPTWPGLELSPRPESEWLEGVSAFQTSDKRSPEKLLTIVGGIRVPVRFALLRERGRPCAFGMLAVDRGYAEIASVMLDPAIRGRGLGKKLVQALLAEAIQLGASTGFLQVESTNAVARSLYAGLGYRDLYRYDTLWLR
jgi:ribosomal protein S18 acetylase RimI-like enzyme